MNEQGVLYYSKLYNPGYVLRCGPHTLYQMTLLVTLPVYIYTNLVLNSLMILLAICTQYHYTPSLQIKEYPWVILHLLQLTCVFFSNHINCLHFHCSYHTQWAFDQIR